MKATGRLNKLYVTMLNDNPDWATEERRTALNQFMARLIFCYFAEDNPNGSSSRGQTFTSNFYDRIWSTAAASGAGRLTHNPAVRSLISASQVRSFIHGVER